MKRTVLIAVALIAVIAIVYVAVPKRDREPTLSLRLKWLYDPGFAGEMVAAKQGLFEANGIKVDIRPGGFESDPIKLVANGSDTFGVIGADSFLLARSKGVPIVAFAAGYIDTPVVYYSHENANIRTLADWKGKRIGIQAGQDTETIYNVLLRKAGLTSTDVAAIPVKYDFSPFLQGAVDVWPGYAATQSYILHKRGIPYRTLAPREYGVSYVGTVYFTTESMVKEHPEWIETFLKSVIDGWNATYSSKQADAIEAISSFDEKNLTPDLVKWNLDTQESSIRPKGRRFCEFTIRDFEAMQSIMMQEGLLHSPIDLSSAISTQFLKQHYR